MIRWGVLAASSVVIAGAAFVAGASKPAAPMVPPAVPARADLPKNVVVIQKTGYFNMAKVMRGYRRAKTSVERLNERRNSASANVRGLRAMFLDLQVALLKTTDASKRAERERELKMIGQRTEIADREVQKLLNNRASEIIVELYDEIHATTVELAREHGLTAVLSFPDAVTQQEIDNPQIKEMKLKPPAAQPFYLDPSVDYTDELIRRLNDRPPPDEK
jgi:Skp family chaperone for outer membrane proteins